MDMLDVSTDMVGVHVYKSYEDVTHVFITPVHIIHVLMDITFLYDLATNRKKSWLIKFLLVRNISCSGFHCRLFFNSS
jgi:hypothetical protein